MKNVASKSIVLVLLVISSFSFKNEWKVNGTVRHTDSGTPIAGVLVKTQDGTRHTQTDKKGYFELLISGGNQLLIFQKPGFQSKKVAVNFQTGLEVSMTPGKSKEQVVPIVEAEEEVLMDMATIPAARAVLNKAHYGYAMSEAGPVEYNTEEYATINENIFHRPQDQPLSTFSIDVDAASYANVRRFLNYGQLPPKDAVRLEEMINYFEYDYPGASKEPFSVYSEVAKAPWNANHQLVHIGLQGSEIPIEKLPPSNLVFLLDVSGSMGQPNKLPLLKKAFKLLVDQMRSVDQIAIVVYAGAAGEVLPSTSGADKDKILASLERLSAGGSTAGGAGINLAYKIARDNFIEGGNNRIIMATDGDFNTGVSSNAQMERLIEEKREEGVFLTVLGFGMGNYKDSKMEILADKGNGNYAYIDNITEAKKVLVSEFGGTLFTIAKDVKIQVEFNPALVQAYRLIGYENRKLNAEDFNDDKKDAGELGSGHTVTALYEIIPVGERSEFLPVDELKYQHVQPNPTFEESDELMTVKLRYKEPSGDTSKLISSVINSSGADFTSSSEDFQWAATVASFGMVLRDSNFKGEMNYSRILEMARTSRGADLHGYRGEMIKLIEMSQVLKN